MVLIPGFEEYAVSREGDVFRVSYPDKGNQGKYTLPHKLTPKVDRYGYNTVKLSVKRKVYYRTIHRLVAETFIANPGNLPHVNHKDGNKLNNNVDNLEWVTPRENTLHAHSTGLHRGNRTRVHLKKEPNHNRMFDTIEEAAKFLNHDRHCFTRHLTFDTRHGVIDGWDFELVGGKNRKGKRVMNV